MADTITIREGMTDQQRFKVRRHDGLARLCGPIYFGPPNEHGCVGERDGPILARFARGPKGWRDLDSGLIHWDLVMLAVAALDRLGLRAGARPAVEYL
jgi:hypothetical protein